MKVLRQLCVLLIFANVGIALWWYFRTDVISYSKPETEPGVPSLILHQEFLKLEHGKQRLQSSACWMIGPFASEGAMQHAMQTLEYVALDMQHRKTMLSDSQGYQVSLPPSADRKQAEILLDKLRNAGIENPGIIDTGPMSNAIDLGIYTDLESAQNSQKLAQQLGFDAVLQSMQSNTPQWWIEATLRNQLGFDQWLLELKPKVPASPCH